MILIISFLLYLYAYYYRKEFPLQTINLTLTVSIGCPSKFLNFLLILSTLNKHFLNTLADASLLM